MPTRRPYAELRRREHLTEAEVERLMEAAKGNRWGLRDPTMVLVAYRHGLRAYGDPARPQGQEGHA
jgi:type 1 fimbriae regulatory protein FimB/type 1 fimbriae regulatory protein FimE